jgi:3-hydroxyisobutyrate dehydrogenase-like beta-hydroxyacid dehydrogenase
MMRIGVVGLGKMGGALVRNLLSQGHHVSVWNRSPDPIGVLVAAGATRHDSLEALVEAVDAVIVMLWGDDVAREVTLAQVIPAANASQIVIEMSTLSPSMYETLENAARERGVGFLAAPVVGSVSAAQQGSLTVLAGGRQATFEAARPLLNMLGTTVTYTGSVGASGYLKLANNTVIGVVAETMAELLVLCRRAGLDRRLAVRSLTGAFERSAGSKKQQLLYRDAEPRFALNALLKDLLLSREAARALHVSMPVVERVLPEVQRAAARGLGNRDYIALALER